MTRETLRQGTIIGRFVVDGRIGAGGMGEVYSARDTVLDRRVALKIIPESLAGDPARVERFLREARAASSLNHPAIVTVYDSGTADGIPYLAMELIEGETLTHWTRRNGKKLIEVLAQVAGGLACAHAGGIVHRDLKPDNIMVAPGPYAKILDFGIAKLTERNTAAPPVDTAPAGVLGTAAFMSPEQIEGRAVDHRSDVFSFGCVMHAAIAGRSPFERATPVETMNAVLNESPPLLDASPHLQRIARRCLSKDPDERYQSMKDVALDLREKPVEAGPRNASTRPSWFAAALVVGGLLGTGMWIRGMRSDDVPQITMQRVTNSGKVVTGAISPDGKYVVHATLDGDRETVWVRQIATGTDVRILPPADGFYCDMKVSPDGNYAFYAYAPRSNSNVVDVYQVPILGGESRKVAENVDAAFSIAPDGHRIAFRRFDAVERVGRIFVRDIDTGAESVVLKRRYPKFVGNPLAWSPDGRHLTVVTGLESDTKVLPEIAQLDIATGRLERMNLPPWPNIGAATWLSDGSGMIISASERQQQTQLWFVPVNGKPPRKITADVATYGDVSITTDSKTLAAHRAEYSSNLWLVPIEHPGEARALTTGIGNYFGTGGVRWLSDHEILYTAFSDQGTNGLKILDTQRGETRQILHGTISWNLAVSPDRSRIAFTSDRSGKLEVWTSGVDGGDLHQLTHGAAGGSSLSFFPDNRSVAYVTYGKEQAIWRVGPDMTRPQRLTDRPANSPQVSPDGTMLVCRWRSVENGEPVWLTAVVAVGSNAPLRTYPIPRSGGPHSYQWISPRAFAFIDSANGAYNIWVQDIDGGPPRQLTRFDSGRIAAFHISPDGKSIVLARGDPIHDVVLIRGFR